MIWSRVEKNNDIGQRPRNFWKNMLDDVTKPADSKWRKWAQKNLTDDECSENDSDEDTCDLKVYNRSKAEYIFKKNKDQVPILPENAASHDLAEMKHIIRSFLKVHYREFVQ